MKAILTIIGYEIIAQDIIATGIQYIKPRLSITADNIIAQRVGIATRNMKSIPTITGDYIIVQNIIIIGTSYEKSTPSVIGNDIIVQDIIDTVK